MNSKNFETGLGTLRFMNGFSTSRIDNFRFIPWSQLLCSILVSTYTGFIHADVIFDGSIGTHANLDPLQGAIEISPERGELVAGNLFHSFRKFSVNTGESATFTGPGGINNVIGRVTDIGSSIIDGPVISNISNANLWLVNPSGIVLGENASLDISGSFHASTADYILLDNGYQFRANNTPLNSTLAVANPVGFGFLTADIAPISVTNLAEPLRVEAGNAISLVGGDLGLVDSSLTVVQGRINLASIAAEGELRLTATGIDVEDATNLGNIRMANSELNVSGSGAGNIYIRGGEFIFESASNISADTTGDLDGGIVAIDVDSMIIDASQISSSNFNDGTGSDVQIDATSLEINNGGSITSSGVVESTTKAGTLRFRSIETLTLNGGEISSQTVSGGDTGDLEFIDIGTLRINGSEISITSDSINAGSIEGSSGSPMTVQNLILENSGEISHNSISAPEDSAISITAGNIRIADAGSNITSTSESGVPANLILTADQFDISGVIESRSASVEDSGRNSVMEIAAARININAGGNLTTVNDGVNASEIQIDVNSLNLIGGQITSFASGSGKGGDVQIDANRLEINDGGSISSSIDADSTVEAGTLRFNDIETLIINRGEISWSGNLAGEFGGLEFENIGLLKINSGRISTIAAGFGNGGNIAGRSGGPMTVGNLLLENNGEILVSDNGQISAGSILIDANDNINIADSGSSIRANAESPSPNTGEIRLKANRLDVSGLIESASVGFEDPGSNIGLNISADTVNINGSGRITSRAEGSADGGNIQFNVGALNITGGEITATNSGTGGSSDGVGGSGSNIGIIASDISLSAGGRILAESLRVDSGAVGSICIGTDSCTTKNGIDRDSRIDNLAIRNGSITTRSENLFGGNIDILANDLVYLVDSDISSSLESGEFGGVDGDAIGGNVTIDSYFVVADRSTLSARAVQDPDSQISLIPGGKLSVTTRGALLGRFRPENPDDFSQARPLIDLPAQDVPTTETLSNISFMDVSGLLQQRCSTTAQTNRSSFAVENRGGMARPPGGYIPSDFQDIRANSGAQVIPAKVDLASQPLVWVDLDAQATPSIFSCRIYN